MKKTHVTNKNKYIERNEGDQWEEKGRTWTIKNGIKKTVTKMDQARKRILTPLACPECAKSMKHRLDKKFWKTHETCFDCVVEMEHEIKGLGKWDEYQKRKMNANAKSFLQEIRASLGEYAENSANNTTVSEGGKIEKWVDPNSEIIKDYIDKEIAHLEEFIEEKDKELDD